MIPQDCLRQEGPRVVLGFGVAWWAVFTTLITFVSSNLTVLIGALIAIRFLLGVGEAVVYPLLTILSQPGFLPPSEALRMESSLPVWALGQDSLLRLSPICSYGMGGVPLFGSAPYWASSLVQCGVSLHVISQQTTRGYRLASLTIY